MFGLGWQSGVDWRLCAAAMAKDDVHALQHALAWCSETQVDEIRYDDHRFIAAIGRRFPKAPELSALHPTIANVSKQLWVRATDNLRRVGWIADYLSEYHVPWAFVGNLAWQHRHDNLFKDCDRPEIMIASEAFSHVVVTLWRNGWEPPADTDIYDVRAPVVFWGADNKSLRLWSDHCLRQAPQFTEPARHWENVRAQRIFHHEYPVLDQQHLMQQTLTRDTDDLQWLIDLKMMSDAPDGPTIAGAWTPGSDFGKRRAFHKLMQA